MGDHVDSSENRHLRMSALERKVAVKDANFGKRIRVSNRPKADVGRMSNRKTRTIFGDDGLRLGEAEYVDEVLDGKCRLWYPDGQLHEESEYRQGQLHGRYRTWWQNGRPKESGQFAHGQRIGRYAWFEINGQLVKDHDFGEPNGS